MTVPLPNIEHIILLMFENRSFDNMLGGFYKGSVNGGGVPSGWSNPLPGVGVIKAWQADPSSAAQIIPYPDPNELYANMRIQMNANGPMQGFVQDYATVPNSTPGDIMQYYRAENVPVTYSLAMAYAASDQYFASGPVQTWPNRLFSLCGTPGYKSSPNQAYVNNTDYPDYPLIVGQLAYPTIFEQLDNAGKSWKVYHDDEFPICAILSYVYQHWDYFLDGGNVWPFEDDEFWGGTFFDDVKNNNLPTFSLIEPRYQMLSFEGDKAPNSNHPGSSSPLSSTSVPISISCGEELLAKVFRALVANPDLFTNTLLIVTYDENGGLFDHVSPPAATSPFMVPIQGFDYSEYGVRVPALFINPYVQSGSLFQPPAATPWPPFDHTSILATLRDQFGLSGSLSPRVDAAPTFSGLLDPTRSPIPAPDIPIPQCVWSAPFFEGHAEPILRSLVQQGSPRARRRSRRLNIPPE